MNIKRIVTILIILIVFVDAGIFLSYKMHSNAQVAIASQTAAVKSVDSTIVADGSIVARDQATLHFQTAGKLILLSLKEGDSISQGQTIAQLDTYALQRQLTQALNTYRSNRNVFDQAQQNQNQNITQKYQRGQLNFYGTGIDSTDPNATNYLNDVAKRIVDENQANLDNSVINVEIANYAMQMATLTSPLTGVITHEDVTVAGQNVTPATSFTVSDPTTKIFRANIPATDIDYISEGMNASIVLDGVLNKINGTISKIYPSKVSLPNGEQVYQIDIQSNDIKNIGKLDQAGTAIIMTNAQNVMLIPAWTVLGGKYVWVTTSGIKQLRSIIIGKIHGDQVEVDRGLSKDDRVITDPKSIPSGEYFLL
ncbi:MAG TPA: HlyD family efflux transporter periplasmic adaptor subunit [Candidatus Sulfotelmatobacter sp.]|jgi:membrane fusion protein (multidrug efflux system)|nr:HlyD family efflux transporter periplasmic adaptor subunit [Candidatus Sulfotelmatobacter sp.]